MVVCLSVLVLRQTDNLSRVYPHSRPMAAGNAPAPHNPELDRQKKMDGKMENHQAEKAKCKNCYCKNLKRHQRKKSRLEAVCHCIGISMISVKEH